MRKFSRIVAAATVLTCLAGSAAVAEAADDWAVAPVGSLACLPGGDPDNCVFFHFGATSDADGSGAGGSVHVSHPLTSHGFEYDGTVTCMEVLGGRAVIAGETDLSLGGGTVHYRGFRLTAIDGGGPGSGLDRFSDDLFEQPVTDCSQAGSATGVVERGDVAIHDAPVYADVAQSTEISSLDSTASKSVTTSCPAGRPVVGGWASHFTDGQVGPDDIVPNQDLTAVTVKALEDETGVPYEWELVAIAFCANPLPGLERVSATSPLSSTTIKTALVTCPVGKRVLGTGAAINAGKGQVILDDIQPSADLTRVEVKAVEDDTGFDGPWSVTAIAICANPPPGLHREAETSPLGSDPGVSAQPRLCENPLGFGRLINAGSGQVRAASTFAPGRPGMQILQMAAFEDENGYDGLWSVTAFQICADAPPQSTPTSSMR